VDRWHLPSIDASGKREPRLLFSTPPACRAVVIDLMAGEEMRDHSVHETAIVQVVSGTVRLGTEAGEAECPAGTLATFAPGERHSVTAVEAARLLLLLAPWPGDGHYAAGEAQNLAANVHVPPLGS
jgi:quercetin dioxygenase-like cupin family protein